ncbi:hypothetical protein SNEBB_003217 [Seison nebaliae]|nr:hypothetical protein SNEBB_003217 [Seison nebaliae]
MDGENMSEEEDDEFDMKLDYDNENYYNSDDGECVLEEKFCELDLEKVDYEYYPHHIISFDDAVRKLRKKYDIIASFFKFSLDQMLSISLEMNEEISPNSSVALKRKILELGERIGTISIDREVGECIVCSKENIECLFIKCHHLCCLECLTFYLNFQLTKKIYLNVCPEHNCYELMSVGIMKEILSKKQESIGKKYERDIYEKLLTFALNTIRKCPTENCPNYFEVEESLSKSINCTLCKKNFCFKCGEEYHLPATCNKLKKWNDLFHTDQQTQSFLQIKTKRCPSCQTNIEKNGGCNHIRCSQCKTEFCWTCLKKWQTHCHAYICSSFTAVDDEEQEKISITEKRLKKYLFFLDRWLNHSRSRRLEDEHRNRLTDHVNDRIRSGRSGTWIDWQYLNSLYSILSKARRTLQFTYPDIFFDESLDHVLIYEKLQARLEQDIENLAWCMEHSELDDRAKLESLSTRVRRTDEILVREFSFLRN